MALSAATTYVTRGASVMSAKVANAAQIYAGAVIGLKADGYADNWDAVTGTTLLGIAQNTVLGDTGATPLPEVEVATDGRILERVAVTGVTAIASTGDLVYATDENTFTLTGTSNGGAIGYIVRWHSSTSCDVKLFTPSEFKVFMQI